jgi:hypothetical protein
MDLGKVPTRPGRFSQPFVYFVLHDVIVELNRSIIGKPRQGA